MTQKILLAGASGKLGFAVLHQLKEQGYWCRTFSRSPANRDKLSAFADEMYFGDATQPSTVVGVSQAIDVVISCLGASVSTVTGDKRPYSQVDYLANHHLLQEAQSAGVQKFIYVAAWVEDTYRQTAYIQGHERFIQELQQSGLNYAVIRPTGLFSAMTEFLDMARKGVGLLLGDGSARTNPVHDQDVAVACCDAINSSEKDIGMGGPDILTRKEILQLAFTTLAKKPRYISVPPALIRCSAPLIGLFDPRKGELFDFFSRVSVSDGIAPARGQQQLKAFFEACQ